MFNDKHEHLKGYAPTPTVRGFGVKIGFDSSADGPKVQQERANYAAMPTLESVADQIRTLELNINREVWTIPASELRMGPATGQVGTKAGAPATIDAVRQAVNMQATRAGDSAPSAASTYVSTIPDLEWRAQQFNRIVQAGGAGKVQVFTWTNTQSGQREIYAITSERYTPYPPSVLIDKLMEVPELRQQKTQVLYSPVRATVRLVSDACIDAKDLAANEIFRIVKVFKTSEDMSSAINSWEELWRSLCTNLALIQKDRSACKSRKHTGTLEDIHTAVASMSNGSSATDLHRHLTACRTAQKVAIPAAMMPPVVAKVTAANEKSKARALLQAPGVRGVDLMTEILRYAGQQESNLYTLHNAVTEVAHGSRWPSSSVTDALQKGATELLHEPVFVSAVMSDLSKEG